MLNLLVSDLRSLEGLTAGPKEVIDGVLAEEVFDKGKQKQLSLQRGFLSRGFRLR
jgi:hypothetical protein